MKAPMTDRTLGIQLDSENKFADVRKKARDEYTERAKRRKKDKAVVVPEYKIGDIAVVSESRWRHRGSQKIYHAIEILDFFVEDHDRVRYFGILQQTTDKDSLCRLGRLIYLGWGYFRSYHFEKIPVSSVKWLKEGKE